MNCFPGRDPEQARELMLQYFQGGLAQREIAELNKRLRADRALRREAAQLLLQLVHLRGLAQAVTVPSPAKAQRTVAAPEFVLDCLRPALSLFSSRLRWAISGAVATAVVLLAVFQYHRGSSFQPALTEISGAVTIQSAEREHVARTGVSLRPGEWVNVAQGASAVVSYPREKTTVRLSGASRMRIDSIRHGKQLLLLTGSLEAAVAPQLRKAPMRITTPEGVATVVGTEFVLRAGQEGTRLEVIQGKVLLTKSGEGSAVLVENDQFGIIQPGRPVVSGALEHGLIYEYWLGVSDPGDSVELRCPATEPSGWRPLEQFEAPVNWGDGFIARARGFLRPTADGQYVFWISGDDRAELWLSTSDDPEGKAKLCWTTDWTQVRDWTRRACQESAPISLKAGRRYYIEAIQSERGGADSLAVAWSRPGLPRELISSRYLTPATPPKAPPARPKPFEDRNAIEPGVP